MQAIYRPKGAALEYAPLALNLYRGCTHACSYCYCPGMLRVRREAFHSGVSLRPGILEQVERDADKLDGTERVHLCFSCDPYPPIECDLRATRAALRMLGSNKIPASVLTKAGYWVSRDFDLLAEMDATFGVSLVWADDERRAEHEPFAAPVADRLALLRTAKIRGLKTWASVEPVIDPVQALAAIDLLLPHADVIKVGRWNHAAEANRLDWRAFAIEVQRRLEAAGKSYLLKRGLAELVPPAGAAR